MKIRCYTNGKDGVVAGAEAVASVALFHACTWIIGPGIETQWDALGYIGLLGLCGIFILLRPSPGSEKPMALSLPKPDLTGIVIYSAITLIVFAALWLLRLEANPDWYRLGVDAPKHLALAAVQVVWLYLFMLPRLCRLVTTLTGESRILRDGSVSLILAGIFAFNHLPNPLLTICTGGIGLVWALAYLRYPNAYLLTLSHAVLLSGYIHLLGQSTRVGPGFLNPGHHAFKNSLQLIPCLNIGVF